MLLSDINFELLSTCLSCVYQTSRAIIIHIKQQYWLHVYNCQMYLFTSVKGTQAILVN